MSIPRLNPLTLTWIALICLPGMALLAFAGWQLSGGGTPSRDALRTASRQAAQHRKWDQLLELGTKWTKLDPQSGEAWLFLAEAHNRREEYQSAVECLEQVPATAPESELALINAMELQFGPLNRPRAGAANAERILLVNPKSPIAHQRLIFFFTMTLQRPRLNRQIRLAFDADAESREAYVYLFFLDYLFFGNGAELNGEWLRGEPDSELFEVAQSVFIAETLDASVSMDDRAAAQAAQRALSKKVLVLEELLRKYPHNSELLAYQLRGCVLTGNVNRAVELLAQATEQAEQDNRFWRFKGWVHAQTGEPQAAEAAYRQALKLHPLDWGTRHLLAELLQRQQRFQEVEQLRKLVNRANELRREIHRAPSARQIPNSVMIRLADYATDCGDSQAALVLKRKIEQYKQTPPNRRANSE